MGLKFHFIFIPIMDSSFSLCSHSQMDPTDTPRTNLLPWCSTPVNQELWGGKPPHNQTANIFLELGDLPDLKQKKGHGVTSQWFWSKYHTLSYKSPQKIATFSPSCSALQGSFTKKQKLSAFFKACTGKLQVKNLAGPNGYNQFNQDCCYWFEESNSKRSGKTIQ